jgi:small multidrug resistance family-3 protein
LEIVMQIVNSIFLFVLACLCEIGGGYLMWQWLRHGKSWAIGLAGAILLVLYGVLPNFQPSAVFGRVYAAYGGFFIVGSLAWDWVFDGRVPDKPDRYGALLCLLGAAVILYWPRK